MSDVPPEEAPEERAARLARLKELWSKADPYIAVVAFVGGFGWDALTLVRIDRLVDNLLLLSYLLLLSGLLVVEHRVSRAPERWPRLAARSDWITYAAQFLVGGLFSAYLVFYTRTVSMIRTLPFIAALAILMFANEFLSDRVRAAWQRLLVYFLCAFNVLLFFIPISTGWPGPGLLEAALGGALVLTTLVGSAMHAGNADPAGRPTWKVLTDLGQGWVAVALVILGMDHYGLIPPVPLALMGGGVFHKVERVSEGYQLSYEEPPWYLPYQQSDSVIRWQPGEAAWCFSSVFAPSGMELQLFHVWDWLDPSTERWVQRDRIRLEIRGGRDGGFRTYSRKRHLVDGGWRVRVVDETDREVGAYHFEVIAGPHEPPALITAIYD